MLLPKTPFEAYRADLVRTPTRESFGSSDSAWLLIATVVRRLGQLDLDERIDYAATFAREAGNANHFQDDSEPNSMLLLKTVSRALEGLGEPDGIDALIAALREVVDDMDAAGALSLSLSFCAAILEAFPDAGSRERGMVLLRRARAARQLGDLEGASELYEIVAEIGERWDIAELQVRADLGRAIVARSRGNYPAARELYLRVLGKAQLTDLIDVVAMAHQGLIGVADAANDYDSALRHGWSAYLDPKLTEEQRVELLMNLAVICTKAGCPEAGLQGSLAVLKRTTRPRLRLPAYSGACKAAARAGRPETLAHLTLQAERELRECSLPFEQAQLLRSLAEAYYVSGDFSKGDRFRNESLELANRHGFHEIAMLAEELPRQLVRVSREESKLTQAASEVVAAMTELAVSA